MQSKAETVEQYLSELPDERKESMNLLVETIRKNLPAGFAEGMGYGMILWFVPHAIYPAGYHCDPKLPLPFISLASQKGNISFYHMGLYAGLHMDWFTEQYTSFLKKKPDMGKSCIRFKKPADIPYELIADLVSRISVQDWISTYEQNYKR